MVAETLCLWRHHKCSLLSTADGPSHKCVCAREDSMGVRVGDAGAGVHGSAACHVNHPNVSLSIKA